MREPRPDWSPLGDNFKILDEHPYLFYIFSILFHAIAQFHQEIPALFKVKH